MIRIATRDDLPRIRELLARANDTPYDLARVAEEKCFGDGLAGAPDVRICDDFAAISVTCGKYLRVLAVDRNARGRGLGTALLREAESRGVTIIGAEAGNYFVPGVPVSMAAFFKGYKETATTHNLVTDDLPSAAPRQPAATGNRQRVLAFVEQHFGRIWRFEAERAGDRLFHLEHDGEIAGFSAHDANNRGLGFFGPTGVAREHRGHGLGTLLLQASLADLRRLGYTRAIIPWTDAVGFYAKACGARVEERFVTLCFAP